MEAEPETKVVDHESKSTKGESAQVLNLIGTDRVVGRYELVHRLGHGGMATVFLGRATGRAGFEKLVAVKVIHPHLANEPEFVDMFLDEARIAARLHHPHLVQILDADEDDGVYYMVMEYVEGDTLASLVRQLRKHEQRLPLSAVLQVAADAAEGLACAHDLADRDGEPYLLVHRDVSPHNLLVGMDGHTKVVDFGIMKAAGKRSNTLTGQLRGKLSYMSPEQAKGRPLDQRTDLFALGAVMWELCTNKRLFEAPTESETLELVAACEVPRLADERPDLPAGLEKLLRRALARNAADRYQTAQQMLRDIRALQREIEVDVDPRAELSKVMHKHFSARVEYIRAAVRRRDNGESRGSSASMMSESMAANGAESAALLSPPRGTPGNANDSARGQAHTGTATATALAGAPARQWTLWLILPLVGAAIGTAVVSMTGRDGKEVVAAAPSEPGLSNVGELQNPPEKKTAEATPMTAQPKKIEESVPSIKWTFNTVPQGAKVVIEGIEHPEVTPLTVTVPKSNESLLIEIVKDGYRRKVLRHMPTETKNFPEYKLVAEPEPEDDAKPRKFLPKKKKLKSTDPVAEAPPPDASDDKGDDGDPDFAGLLDAPRKND